LLFLGFLSPRAQSLIACAMGLVVSTLLGLERKKVKVLPVRLTADGEVGCTPALLQQFDPPIKHVEPDNPWLPLLTPGQLVEMNRAFKQFDRDGDGHIEPKEMRTVMKELGLEITEEKAKKLIAGVDTDGNGMIEFDEFVTIMAERMNKDEREGAIDSMIFKQFDDGSGFVRVDKLKEMMCRMGFHKLSDKEFNEMVKMMEVDDQGRIPFEDFRLAPCWHTPVAPKPTSRRKGKLRTEVTGSASSG